MKLNESTTTIDVGGVELKLEDIIYRIYTESLIGAIGAKMELDGPQGSVFAFKTTYETDGKGVDKSSTFFGTVIPDFAQGSPEGEVKASVKHEVVKRPINCGVARKIKSKWSIEALQDLIALTPKNKVDKILEKELLTELIQEIDFSALQMMIKKAKKENYTILAPNDPLVGVELFNIIQSKALEMVNNVKKVATICVTAPTLVCAKLMSHPNFKANVEFSNAYYMGDIGAAKIFCDPFKASTDNNYALISYVARDETIDGSTIFAFYNYDIQQVTDQNTGEACFFHYYRSDVVQNPLDETTDNNSKFLTYIKIQ